MKAVTHEDVEYEAVLLLKAVELARSPGPDQSLGQGQVIFAASARGMKQQLEAIKGRAQSIVDQAGVPLDLRQVFASIIACADLALDEARGDYYPRGRDLLES